MITGVSSNLTVLAEVLGVISRFAKSFLTSLLMSLGIRLSSTPFSTVAMGVVCSGSFLISGLKLESELLSSGPPTFLDLVLRLPFLALLSNSRFLVELRVATLCTGCSILSGSSTSVCHLPGFSTPAVLP